MTESSEEQSRASTTESKPLGFANVPPDQLRELARIALTVVEGALSRPFSKISSLADGKQGERE